MADLEAAVSDFEEPDRQILSLRKCTSNLPGTQQNGLKDVRGFETREHLTEYVDHRHPSKLKAVAQGHPGPFSVF
jgi:hypothetical protein